MSNKNFYPRDKSVSSVFVANAAKPDIGKPRDLANTVCFTCGKRGHVRAKCLSNTVQGSNKSAGNEHAKKAGRTFRCSVTSEFRPNEHARQSECGQSTGTTRIESPVLAQAGASVVSVIIIIIIISSLTMKIQEMKMSEEI